MVPLDLVQEFSIPDERGTKENERVWKDVECQRGPHAFYGSEFVMTWVDNWK